MTRALAILIVLLLSTTIPSHAQSDAPEAQMQIGLHSGVQTSVLRYSVFPYTGEFQSTVEQGVVYGVSLGLPISATFRFQVDVGLWSQSWTAMHSGDPSIGIDRGTRSAVEFPLLLQYRPGTLPVPVYLSAGPVVSLLRDGKKSYTVSYTGFTEKEGWRTSTRDFDEETLRIGIAGEAGLDAPLGETLSLQMAVRLMHPLGKAVDTSTLALRELSVWRFRLGVLLSI
jgi:hypothetical protein